MEPEIQKEIEDIVNCHLKDIETRYIKIMNIIKSSYGLPELDYIKNQICRCILFDLHVAAMTLLNHFLEKSIKILLIYSEKSTKNEKTGYQPFEMIEEISIATTKYDNKNLFENINTAFEKGIITVEEKSKLLSIKDNYRNAYSHSDRKKLYKDNSIEITEIYGIEKSLDFIKGKDDKLPKKEVELYNLPLFDFLFIKTHAEQNSVPYLIVLDGIIRSIKERLMPNTND